MRVKKLLKVGSIVLASIALVGLVLVCTFLVNVFEGSLPQVRDAVPRGVDFYVHKGNIAGDFQGVSDAFPYVPVLTELGKDPHWTALKRSAWYRDIDRVLRDLRRTFEQMRKDVPIVHLVNDFIGREVQVAGRFGPHGFADSKWCVYTRVSMKGRAGYGLLRRNFVRDELRKQGVIVVDQDEFYKLTAQGKDYYCARYLDCVMIGNDLELVRGSFELAQGNTSKIEPLGPSGHYKDGVQKPLLKWMERTKVPSPNVLEFHLRPEQWFPTDPDLRNWPASIQEDEHNKQIRASFFNLGSWRFLSGTVVFEPNSISLQTHLVVNHNKHTPFQKDLFTAEATPRRDWMDQFFRMVPGDACGAAALRMPAGGFIREMVKDVFTKDDRVFVDEAIRRTGKYKGFDDMVGQLETSLLPRVGVIMRPNRRSAKSVQTFPVLNESPFPQWTMVFWVRKNRVGQALSQPLADLILLLDKHRAAFNIVTAYKLDMSNTGGYSDAAFEFAIPQVPGTGNVAVATYSDYFIVGNDGPFIHRVALALNGKVPSMKDDKDFGEFEVEMPESINGVAFVWAKNLRKVVEDFVAFGKKLGGVMDGAWALANRPRAENLAFEKGGFKGRYGLKSRVPDDERRPGGAFHKAVNDELDRMWAEHQRKSRIAGQAALEEFGHLVETFRTAYLQMVLTSTSLQIWSRVLGSNYNR
ncbi:MAG: hypothetical protein KDC87_20620 [Planctomycetes bacterium]|nr:hypothetical protein [Planctomycetota bacterium]